MATHESRRASVRVSPEALTALLRGGSIDALDLPEDARVVWVTPHYETASAELVLESEAFPPVAEGAPLPPLSGLVHSGMVRPHLPLFRLLLPTGATEEEMRRAADLLQHRVPGPVVVLPEGVQIHRATADGTGWEELPTVDVADLTPDELLALARRGGQR